MAPERDNENHRSLTIEAVCEETGVSRSTIYQYQRMGLLHAPVKIAPKQLRYDASHLKRIGNIREMREKEKMPLPMIKEVLQSMAPEETEVEVPAADLRLQIINEAAIIFSKKGFSNTTISDITDALKIGKGTFYGYFKSKEDLFLESIERLPEIIIPKYTWKTIKSEKDYFQRTHLRARTLLESFPIFSGISSIAKFGLNGNDETMAKKARSGFHTITRPIVKELQEAIKQGVVRDLDVEAIAFLMYGFAEAMGYWKKMSPDYTVKVIADIGMDLLYNGMKPRKESYIHEFIQADVKTRKGSIIQLAKIRFDDTQILSGRMEGGELSIDLETISSVLNLSNKNDTTALVTLNTGEEVNLEVQKSKVFSGTSTFGHFKIPISEITEIIMQPSSEDPQS